MGYYVFAPAGPIELNSTLLKKCIEYIGSTQAGLGSPFAKGKRYLKYQIPGCSSNAIKRASQTRKKIWGHDFQTYGINVYYYHSEFCVEIVSTVIEYVIKHSNDEIKHSIFGLIPTNKEYLDLLYKHRISQLKWVRDEDYMGQGEKADTLVTKFEVL